MKMTVIAEKSGKVISTYTHPAQAGAMTRSSKFMVARITPPTSWTCLGSSKA
jgi:hypothetical protein